MLLTKLKFFFYCFFLSQIAFNFISQLMIKLVLISHSFEQCNFSYELIFCRPDGRNNTPYLRDIVSQNNATKELQKCYNKTLLISYREKITKSYSHHRSCSPIISPHVLYIPWFVLKIFRYHPIHCIVQFRHSKKHGCNKVCKNKIERY